MDAPTLQRLGRHSRPKAPNILDNSVSSSHPHEFARVFLTIAEISAVSTDISQRDHEERLPTATLSRVSALSKSIWEEIQMLPLSAIPPLHNSLTVYELILVDIQHILISEKPLKISGDTIDSRLDDFILKLQQELGLLKDTFDQRSSPNSTHFFENAHHIVVSGGNFSTSNPVNVVHDPIVREQSHKILRMIYIQCGVLFS